MLQSHCTHAVLKTKWFCCSVHLISLKRMRSYFDELPERSPNWYLIFLKLIAVSGGSLYFLRRWGLLVSSLCAVLSRNEGVWPASMLSYIAEWTASDLRGNHSPNTRGAYWMRCTRIHKRKCSELPQHARNMNRKQEVNIPRKWHLEWMEAPNWCLIAATASWWSTTKSAQGAKVNI